MRTLGSLPGPIPIREDWFSLAAAAVKKANSARGNQHAAVLESARNPGGPLSLDVDFETWLKVVWAMPKIFLGTAGVDGTSTTEDRLPHHKQVEARLRAPLEATEAFIKLASARVTANVSPGSSAAPRPGGPDLEQRVRTLMARGEVSRAAELLSQEGSPGPTLLDEPGVQRLQALHPPPPPSGPPIPGEDEAKVRAEERRLEDVVRRKGIYKAVGPLAKALKHLRAHKAAGPNGWCVELTADRRFNKELLSALDGFTAALACGHEIPVAARPTIYGGRLVPIPKSDGGLRPIFVGDFFVKIAGRRLEDYQADAIKRTLSARGQYGVGVASGSEAILLGVRGARP